MATKLPSITLPKVAMKGVQMVQYVDDILL